MTSPPEIRIFDGLAEMFQAAATEFARLATDAVLRNGRFTVALSGGSTPKTLYSRLATDKTLAIPWEKICFFFGDERHVPPDHPDSNYRMANEAMLSHVPVRKENVFRMRGEEADANAAAQEYEKQLQKFFALQPGQFPVFDLILLGLGPDGHTASLFPGTAALTEKQRLVVANWVEKFKTDRITFTYPLINNAACVMFLASGADKAAMLHEVLENPSAGLPSQGVRPVNGRLVWMLDRAAAAALSGR